MCCGKVGHLSTDSKKLEDKLECGLITRHAYSLIKTMVISYTLKDAKAKKG